MTSTSPVGRRAPLPHLGSRSSEGSLPRSHGRGPEGSDCERHHSGWGEWLAHAAQAALVEQVRTHPNTVLVRVPISPDIAPSLSVIARSDFSCG